MTPEELEKQREAEAAKRDAFKRTLRLQTTLSAAVAISQVSQLSPLDKINQTVNERIEDLKDKAVTSITTLAAQLGIEGIDTPNPKLPNLCPSAEILNRVLQIRNSLGVDIENTSKYINIVDTSLQALTPIVNGTATTLDAIAILKTATSAATKLTPLVPGAVTALLSDLDDLRTLITFKTNGTPKLPELQRALTNGASFISDAAKGLESILTLIQVVDLVLQKCGKQPNALGADVIRLVDTIKLANNSIINEVYNGFTFSIIEKQFSPTLNQKIGQAKNSQGIVLLQTEPSFTQDPQVLVEELKFIINRDNLKAN